MEPARFERAVAVGAGLVLAASGWWFVPGGGGWDTVGLSALLSPPFAMGAIAAAIAASARFGWRRAWITAAEVVMILATAMWSVLGSVLIAPGLIVLGLGIGWFQFVRRGDTEERSARVVTATGALWSLVFGIAVFLERASFEIHVVLAASVALGTAGCAWLHAIRRAYIEQHQPPRAVAR